MNRDSLRPSRSIFQISGFFVPFVTLGLSYNGISIYLCLIIILCDLSFWSNLIFRNFDRKAIESIAAILLLLSLVCFRSSQPFPTAIKITGIIAFVVYYYFGLKSYKQSGLIAGISTACILSAIQFIEVNFFGSNTLDPQSWTLQLYENVSINIKGTGGASHAEHALFKSLRRVSGSAVEPGHFSAILFASLGIVRGRTKPGLLLLIAAFAAFSRITLFLFILLVAIRLLNKYCRELLPLLAPAVFTFYFLVGSWYHVDRKLETPMIKDNASLYDRFLAVEAFSHLPTSMKIFGAGIQNTCKSLDSEFLKTLPGNHEDKGYSKHSNPCIIGQNSMPGSFLLEQGIVGLVLLVFISIFLDLSKRKGNDAKTMGRQNPLYLVTIAFCSLLSVHYITFFPIVYAILSKSIAMHRGVLRLE